MMRIGVLAAALLVLALAVAGEDLPRVDARPPVYVEALPRVDARPPVYFDAVPRGPSVDERLAEIARRVQQASRYPPIARERGATGEALVAFEIGANGRAKHIELTETSGNGALDRAAVRAVAEAAPLPFVYGRILVPLRFTLESRD